jgi:hypothetical protein
MAGLVPAIHVFAAAQGREDVDARDKRGHDGGGCDSIRTDPALAEKRELKKPLTNPQLEIARQKMLKQPFPFAPPTGSDQQRPSRAAPRSDRCEMFRFDELDKVVEELKRKEKVDGRKKRE